MADGCGWSDVRVKTRKKAYLLDEILINARSENLPKSREEKLQYLRSGLKLNLFGEKKTLVQSD